MAFRILGLDLSMGSPGFAVVEINEGGKATVLYAGHIKTNAKLTHGERLMQIEAYLQSVVSEYKPFNAVVREKGFSRHNITTQTIFRVVGVSDLMLAKEGYVKVVEIAPTTVKKLVCGNGKATKDDVKNAVRNLVASAPRFKTDDESDAVAVALAYALQQKLISV